MLTGLLALASAQDWTCDECAEAGTAVPAFLSSPENIAAEVAILIDQVCPQHPDPEFCGTVMPTFWGTIGPVVWAGHWPHCCDDLDCGMSGHPLVKSSVPSCESCLARVNGVADALAWEDTITAWVGVLSEYCATFSTHVPECQEAMAWGVPLAFRALVESDRGWTQAFCEAWTAC